MQSQAFKAFPISIALFIGLGLLYPLVLQAKVSIPVTTEKASNLLFYPKHTVASAALSLNQAKVKAETQGRVVELPLLVGDYVKKGGLIAALDCRDQTFQHVQMRAAVEGTHAKIELLTWQLKQSKQLAEQKNASLERIKMLEAELKLNQAQLNSENSQVEHAKHQVDRCRITAPFDGVITSRLTHLGEFIAPGTPIVELIAHQDVEAQAFFHPEEVKRIEQARNLKFQTRDKSYNLKLRKQVQNLDENTHTQELRFTFVGQAPLPGTLGKIVWQEAKAHLPSDFLIKRGDKYGVFINQNTKAEFVAIPGAREGQPVPVPDRFNHELIIQGRQQLEQGVELHLNQESA